MAVGRIIKAHGIRGEVTVEPWLGGGEALASGARVHLRFPGGEVRDGRVEAVRPHGERLLIRLEGVPDRTRAEALVKAEIRVERMALPALGEHEYLWEDLIGLEVFSESGKSVGLLQEVVAAGPRGENEYFVVRTPAGDREILLPATREVIREVDFERGRMKACIPPVFCTEEGRKD